MYKRVPPLRALRAFEASARLLSFTKASEELYVTQAAVSLQVKQLEELLEVQLFRRGARSLELTDEGMAFLEDVREALTLLENATARISRRHRQGQLNVSVTPSFAAKWLVPRLKRFQQDNPDIDVRISATEWLVDFDKDTMDIAIRYGNGQWAGLKADLLMHENVFPVCSPKLAAGEHPLKSPKDLVHHTLLHDDFSREDWRQWLMAAVLNDIDPDKGISFSHTALMLEAAANSGGVALGRTPLVDHDLESGRLVRPFDQELPSDFAYYIITPDQSQLSPAVLAFHNWLLKEAEIEL